MALAAGHRSGDPSRWQPVAALVAATIWCAGNAVCALAAASIFSHASPADTGAAITRATAGLLFGDLLRTWLPVGWILAAALLPWVAWAWRAGGVVRIAAPLALGVALGLHAWGVLEASRAHRLRPAYANGDAQVRAAFDAAHRGSSAAFRLETATLAVVVAGLAITLGRRRSVAPSGDDRRP